ncbi:MAG: PAS domain S-box protein [Chloroflexi bacterium]|nr:PAS domain S-box protein [Chloroflexota bacterium]
MTNLWGEFAGLIAERMSSPFVILDDTFRVKVANRAFYKMFHTTPEQTESQPLLEVAGGVWNIPGLAGLLEKMLAGGTERVQVAHTFPGIGRKLLIFDLNRTDHQRVIFLTVEDVSTYDRLEEVLTEAYTELEKQITERTADLLEANRDLRQQLQQHRQMEEALKRSQERFAGILDIAVDAIISVDQRQTIQFFNQGAEYIFGYRADEVIGKPLALLLPPRFRQSHGHHIQRFAGMAHTAQHMHERSPISGLRKDGTEFPAEASISKLEHNGDWTFTVILRDITERRRMEENLRRALAEARELSDLRSRFISMVSHELRTPLAVILSSSQVLENYSHRMTPQQKQEYHDSIKQQVQHLTELLEDTLAISRAETVGLDFNPEPGNLTAFCRSLAEKIELATDHSHRINFSGGGGCQNARFDEHLLWLILNNLLSNAVKYSPNGSAVELLLTCADGQATIQVSDEGIGIPAHDQARLFESFHRGSNVGVIPGTGLGLAIVKQAVKAHGGSIAFETQEGLGTTFTVTLPISKG